MTHEHRYAVAVEWTGNQGQGTADYRAYGRDHLVTADGKPAIAGSSDPAFRGDRSRWNPEELLVVAVAQCHMLWYLHLAAVAGIVVEAYRDAAGGVMVEHPDGSGNFTAIVLRPQIVLAAGADLAKARALHEDAHEKCFVARSVNFPVTCEPNFTVAGG
jgi:organic hydroperoxide reductase OsmC/OhrA